MKRREFLAIVSIAATWSFAARAQKKPALIGWLGSGSAQSSAIFVESFKQGLLDGDLREGRDYLLDLRWAAGAYELFSGFARELVDNKVDVILATTISAVRAAQQTTTITPIIMTSVTDAVGAGLVKSLAYPGGNTTGLSNLNEDLTPKLLDFFRLLLPQARLIAAVGNPGNPSTKGLMDKIQTYASSFDAKVSRWEVKDVGQIGPMFDRIAKEKPDAILVVPDAALIDLREPIAANAVKYGIPLISTIPELTDAGALIGYGAPRRELYRRAGYFVKRIFDGSKPADLPVEQPRLIEFSINSKTATQLGIRIPNDLMVRADRVIE